MNFYCIGLGNPKFQLGAIKRYSYKTGKQKSV